MAAPQSITFHFDPVCPWTWRTWRWLVDAADRHGVAVRLSPFELSDGAPIDQLPEEYRASSAASREFLRAVVKARFEGRDDLSAAAYTRYGAWIHDESTPPTTDLVRSAWHPAGESFRNALTDESLDEAVAASRGAAAELAGDDVGSPVLVLDADGSTRGLFGPVVAPTPTGAEADRLWDLVLAAADMPQFFELKTRRTASP